MGNRIKRAKAKWEKARGNAIKANLAMAAKINMLNKNLKATTTKLAEVTKERDALKPPLEA